MSDMSEREMFGLVAETKAATRVAVDTNAASELLEGVQEGVAEKREAKEQAHKKQIQALSDEVQTLLAEIDTMKTTLAQAEEKKAKSLAIIEADSDSDASAIHKKLILLREAEIATLRAELQGKEESKAGIQEFLDNL